MKIVWTLAAVAAFPSYSSLWPNGGVVTAAEDVVHPQLRTASSHTTTTTTTTTTKSSDPTAESSCNRATSLSECRTLLDDESQLPCEWCVAGAIPSECMSPAQAALLPEAVFECSTPGVDEINEEEKEDDGRQYQFLDGTVGVRVRAKESEDSTFCDATSKSISGYIDLSNSQYNQNSEDKHLFFWMFEKRPSSSSNESPEEDASTVPFVVWLTGGPGCSSTLALLTENGPCSVNPDGKSTTRNPHSWTETAHVLWLDQPAGVGFSYGQETDTNEEMVSEDAYWFLQGFFQAYPEYATNPLYIVGESYAGHYVPAIAHRIHVGNQKLVPHATTLPLAGLAIGNGLTDPEKQYPWYPEMAYNNSHHLQVVSEQVYDTMKGVVPHCTKLIAECNSGDSMVNTFACQSAFVLCNMGLTSPYQATGLNPYDMRIPCEVPPLCYDMSFVGQWLNAPSTKKALNVDPKHSHAWQSCNFGINMRFHTDWMKTFAPFVADLLEAGIPALVYAGDVDFVCNYLGNRAWTLQLEWTGAAKFNAAEERDWDNGSGLIRSSGGLTFLQVYDAGHMVPKDQPAVSLSMLKQFLAKEL